jgi:hypothetical protein
MPRTVGRPRTGPHGVTVLELVVSLSLVAAVIAAVAAFGRTTARVTHVHDGRLDAQQGARRALERIIEELRWAEHIVPDPLCGGGLCPNRVRARIPSGNPYRQDQAYEVTFQHNPGQQEVERRVGMGTNNLAALVQRVEFTYHTSDGRTAAHPSDVARVGVSLTVATRAGPPLMLNGGVALRNRHAIAILPSPSPTASSSPPPMWRPSPRRTFSPGGLNTEDVAPPYDSPGLR